MQVTNVYQLQNIKFIIIKKTQNISKFNRGNIIILAPKHAKKII